MSIALCSNPALAVEAEPAAPAAVDRKPANWKELNVAEPTGGSKAAAGPARLMLRQGQLTDQAIFDGYWKWYIAQITKYAMRDDLPKTRTDLQTQLRSRSGAPQQRLVREILLPATANIARDKEFAPVVRVNALYILGDLNQKEADPQGRGAVALPDALPHLLVFLDPKLPADGGVNDALRVAAIVGLQNHADRGGIQDPKLKEQAVKLLQPLAQDQANAAQRPPEVNEWLQKRAQEVLNKMGNTAVAGRPRAVAAGGR